MLIFFFGLGGGAVFSSSFVSSFNVPPANAAGMASFFSFLDETMGAFAIISVSVSEASFEDSKGVFSGAISPLSFSGSFESFCLFNILLGTVRGRFWGEFPGSRVELELIG